MLQMMTNGVFQTLLWVWLRAHIRIYCHAELGKAHVKTVYAGVVYLLIKVLQISIKTKKQNLK